MQLQARLSSMSGFTRRDRAHLNQVTMEMSRYDQQ
jgi:hypothetical protein